MIEVTIVGVRIEMPSNQPLVLLRESVGERHIPIWIGAAEATAIALAEQGVVPPRPLTHDLLCGVVLALGRSVARVNLTKVEDGVFYAEIVFDNGTTIGSRASDAIAIAQRAAWRKPECTSPATRTTAASTPLRRLTTKPKNVRFVNFESSLMTWNLKILRNSSRLLGSF